MRCPNSTVLHGDIGVIAQGKPRSLKLFTHSDLDLVLGFTNPVSVPNYIIIYSDIYVTLVLLYKSSFS